MTLPSPTPPGPHSRTAPATPSGTEPSKRSLQPVKPARGRRWRYALQSFALLFAVTSCVALGVLMADRFPRRYDVTATREHQLSKRSLDLLGGLNGDYELIVAANFSGVDPIAARRTQDVLDNIARASPRVRTTVIDVASTGGLADLDALLKRLVDRFQPALDRQAAGAGNALTNTGLSAQSLASLSDELLATNQTVVDGDPNTPAVRKFLSDAAAVCRVTAQGLESAVTSAEKLHGQRLGRTPIPATEDALAGLRRALADALGQLKEISDGLDGLTRAPDSAVAAHTRDRARPVAIAAARARDEIGRTLTAIDDLPRTPLTSVAYVLERSSAAIVVGPPGTRQGGVASIDVASLFPPRPKAGEAPIQVDLRARTEELLTAAIASLSREDAPIVVLMHGEASRLAPQFAPFTALIGRLRLRAMDLVEWPVALDTEPPALTGIDPTGKRPVVYATISTSPATPDGANRATRLAAAIARLIDDRKPVLLSVAPSIYPASGQKDPMVEFLAPLGIQADSGRPLLRQTTGAQGRTVEADHFFTSPQAEHAVSAAIRGLATRFPWPIPLRITQSGGAIEPILVTDNAGKTVWAESEWAEFRRVPPRDRSMVTNPPANDTLRDDGAGPWTLAAAVERAGNASKQQRLIIVGSNGWFLDEVTQGQTVIDGRPVFFNPGNTELFEASVYWLAGQEAFIGASAQAAASPLIPPLTEELSTLLRWFLIGGLPVMILLIGALWRLIRG